MNFFATTNSTNTYINIKEDWTYIVQSFAKLYGIRLLDIDDEEMDFEEFILLLYGCDEETPIGNLVRIRSAEGEDYRNLNQREKKIWRDWRIKHPNYVKQQKTLTIEDLFLKE